MSAPTPPGPAIPPLERAALYRLFARLLTAAPDAALLDALGAPAAAAVLERAAPGFSAWLGALGSDGQAALGTEFARLFLLPRGAAPYASAWIEGDRERLAGQLAAFTHRLMAALDMQQTGSQGNLSQDHLGLLFAVTAEALSRPEAAALAAHAEGQLLGPWVRAFADALYQRAESPLYRALGRLIPAVVPLETSAETPMETL